MAEGGEKKEPPEMVIHLQEMENAVLKLKDMTGGICNLDENTKRWLLVGIGLNTVMSPALRKFVKQELDQLWQILESTNNISTQLYPKHMTCYRTTHFNYEAINNNRVHGLKQQKMFDYKVSNSVDLSKLFLQTHMTQYSAFDESCDLSALLGILNKTGICSPNALPYAEQLRDQVRNPWAHCNYTLWDQTKYKESFDIMTNLIINLGLSAQGDLDKLKISGDEFIDGRANVTADVFKQFQSLLKSVKLFAVDTPERIHTLRVELSKIEKTFSNQECRIQKLEQEAESNQEETKDRPINYTGNSGLTQAKLNKWKDENKTFVVTKAAKSILKCVQKNKCVAITGSSGMGKTATLRHIVLQMADQGYDIIPVTEPRDVEQYYNAERKTVFMVDDFCGTFSANKIEAYKWTTFIDQSYQYFNRNTKIIVACRLQVYNDPLLKNLSVFKTCECNLQSSKFKSLDNELQSIANIYLDDAAGKISDYVSLYHCFPLLCKLYKDNPSSEITKFFQDPFSVYEEELSKMYNAGHNKKYCALFLCIVFNNSLEDSLLTDDINEETGSIFKNVFEVCRLDTGTSRLYIKDELDTLLNSFLRKEGHSYKTIHDKMFDFLSNYFGKNEDTCKCLIRNARSRFISERFSLFKKQSNGEFTIDLDKSLHDFYMARIKEDLNKIKPLNGELSHVFGNENMIFKEYRDKLLDLIKTLDEHKQQEIADSNDIHDQEIEVTVMMISCFLGDVDWLTWCLNHHNDINSCDNINGLSPLYAACCGGNTDIVIKLLDRGADINKCCPNGATPLDIACYHGNTETVKVLLDRGADINKCRTDDGSSPLHSACYNGHTDTVKVLLDRGADINKCRTDDGSSPLHSACYNGHTDTVKVLLDRGADINKCRTDGSSLLHSACRKGNTETVKVLLDRGADINKCRTNGSSPLDSACYNGHTDTVKLLLDRGAEINKCRTNGSSPLDSACYNGHTDTVTLLLDRGAETNKCRTDGTSPLHSACFNGHTDTVKVLLDRGAEINKCRTDGTSPLDSACYNGHTDTVQVLLDGGAKINKCRTDGSSPLYSACRRGNTETVTVLLDRGADINKCTTHGATPLDTACYNGHTDTVKVLLDRGVNINTCRTNAATPLDSACYNGHTDIVKVLLDSGADINKCRTNGTSPLDSACRRGNTETVTVLLDRGADINKCRTDGTSPLDMACYNNHADVVKILLDRGADINKCRTDGSSPLYSACRRGNTETVTVLLDRGADINKCITHGATPLDTACYNGHTDTVKVLLDRGVNINACRTNGATPLYSACYNGHTDIVKVLLDSGADINKCRTNGTSPLRLACFKDHTDTIKVLLDRGADINKCRTDESSPLHSACYNCHTDIVKVLLDSGADINKCRTKNESSCICRCSIL